MQTEKGNHLRHADDGNQRQSNQLANALAPHFGRVHWHFIAALFATTLFYFFGKTLRSSIVWCSSVVDQMLRNTGAAVANDDSLQMACFLTIRRRFY